MLDKAALRADRVNEELVRKSGPDAQLNFPLHTSLSCH